MIKVTLNKLSPSNVDKLKEQLFNIGKESRENLYLLVSGIFEKAWSEIKYTSMYAHLCFYFRDEFENFSFPNEEESKSLKKINEFRNLLLLMCEDSFKFTHQDTDLNLTEEEIEYKRGVLKRKTMGNVRFIGELFNVKLITVKIVLLCIHDLLSIPCHFDEDTEIDEEKIEGVCILLSTGGPGFERAALKAETNRIFEFLSKLVSLPSLKSKLKFMMMVIAI